MAGGTKLILEVDDSYRPSDFRLVKEVVKALHQADERATDFRYARRNDGTRSLEGIHYVNTRWFGEKWERFLIYLTGSTTASGICWTVKLNGIKF